MIRINRRDERFDPAELGRPGKDSGYVAAWVAEAVDQAGSHGVVVERHYDDRKRAARLPRGASRGLRTHDNNVRPEIHELSCKGRQSIHLILRGPALDPDVGPVNVTEPAEPSRIAGTTGSSDKAMRSKTPTMGTLAGSCAAADSDKVIRPKTVAAKQWRVLINQPVSRTITALSILPCVSATQRPTFPLRDAPGLPNEYSGLALHRRAAFSDPGGV